MATPKRVDELAAMRAPNMSGVDTTAVLKALAGNPKMVSTPTTYAYGMNVEDAQREAQLGNQYQQQREASLRDARNAAVQQDQQRFEQAMKANAQYMAERNLTISERVSAAEIAYKKAMMAGIPADIEARKLANEKLALDIEREKEMDALRIAIPDPANPGKSQVIPARAFMGAGGKNILSYLTGKGTNETSTERLIRKKAETYAGKGIDQDDAFLLASSKPDATFQQISKAIDLAVKNKKPRIGQPNYGIKGVGKDGKPIAKTEDDYRAELYNQYIDSYFPMLSEPTRTKLKEWGPGSLNLLENNPDLVKAAEGEAQVRNSFSISPESMTALINALTEAYK